MAVTAQQGQSRDAEALQMHLVADAVAGLGAEDAVLLGHALDVLMVIRVFKAGLQGVVVNIGYALHGSDPADAHGLKLQVSHGSRGVLRQGLVNPDGDLFACRGFSTDKMGVQNLLS